MAELSWAPSMQLEEGRVWAAVGCPGADSTLPPATLGMEQLGLSAQKGEGQLQWSPFHRHTGPACSCTAGPQAWPHLPTELTPSPCGPRSPPVSWGSSGDCLAAKAHCTAQGPARAGSEPGPGTGPCTVGRGQSPGCEGPLHSPGSNKGRARTTGACAVKGSVPWLCLSGLPPGCLSCCPKSHHRGQGSTFSCCFRKSFPWNHVSGKG